MFHHFTEEKYLVGRSPASRLTRTLYACQARPDLSIQDITALLVSLTNLSLSCYPTRQQYISQILHFAREKTMAFQDSPDLHHPVTANNLRNLLLAPINTYPSVLQLLSLEGYEDLLRVQSFGTRRALAHAVVHSVLKNQTVIGTPQHVDDVLRLCHVMVKDQKDAGVGMASHPGKTLRERNMEEMAEEQGWISRMVHLFRSDNLDTQFAVSQGTKLTLFDIPTDCHRTRIAAAGIGKKSVPHRWAPDTVHPATLNHLHHSIGPAHQLQRTRHSGYRQSTGKCAQIHAPDGSASVQRCRKQRSLFAFVPHGFASCRRCGAGRAGV